MANSKGKHAVDRTLLTPSPELDATVRALYAIACAESAEPALRWLDSYCESPTFGGGWLSVA